MSDDDWVIDADVVIGGNIARKRKTSGLSQTALAEAMREAGVKHWHQNTVSRVERGEQSLNVGEMAALEGILGGNLLAGTRIGDTMSEIAKFGRSLHRDAVARKLSKADRALSEALDDIRTLRYHFDDEFRDEHPEYGERED